MTVTNAEIIEALKKGREQRPIQIEGSLFGPENSACALGAIAVGFGLKPIEIEEGDYEQPIYDALNEMGIPTSTIFSLNDDCWGFPINHPEIDFDDFALTGYQQLRDPDAVIIEYLKSGELNHE